MAKEGHPDHCALCRKRWEEAREYESNTEYAVGDRVIGPPQPDPQRTTTARKDEP
jgi:hypothetical protein